MLASDSALNKWACRWNPRKRKAMSRECRPKISESSTPVRQLCRPGLVRADSSIRQR